MSEQDFDMNDAYDNNDGINEQHDKEVVSQDESVAREAYETRFSYDSGVAVEPAETKKTKVKKTKVKKEKKKGSRVGGKIVAACAVGLAFGIFAAGGFYGTTQMINHYNTVEVSDSQIETLQKQIDDLSNSIKKIGNTPSYTAADLSAVVTSDVTSVVDKVMPSMVCVQNTTEQTYYFWGRTYTQETPSSGSGIIIGENDSEYLIATNYHVIEDSKSTTVQFVDGTTVSAYAKGYDSAIDIAVIAVKKDDLEASTKNAVTVAKLGDSDSLKIGEPAIAIGNALGYGQSVTTGVISALNREIDLENSVSDLIQTSAAINPGNSGGALLNIYGEVIGINSSKINSSSVEGMGFAIPISEVKDIIVDFSNREVRSKVSEDKKGYLGISCRDSAELNLTLLGYPDGVYVESVYEGSAADEAQIYAGDLITKIDGQSIKSYEELQDRLSYYAEGDVATITVARRVNGAFVEYDINVTLGNKASVGK